MESWTTLTNKKDLAVITFGMYETLTHDRNPGYELNPAFFVMSQSQLWTGECCRKMEPVNLWSVTMLGCYEWRSISVDKLGRDVGKYEDGVEQGGSKAQWLLEHARNEARCAKSFHVWHEAVLVFMYLQRCVD